MRVAIDATPLSLSSGGLARYTSELSLALAREFPEDEYSLVSDQSFALPDGATPNLSLGCGPRTAAQSRWWLWGVYWEQRRLGTEVFHGTNFAVPYLPARPSVMTVHDLSPWLDPGSHASAGRVGRRTPWMLGLGLANMVIAPSKAVRAQVVEFFRLNPGQVVATPLAADPSFRRVATRPRERPYFLFVGTLEPRKNLDVVMDAWRQIRHECGVDLVLVGRRREDFPQLPPEPGLTFAGEVPDGELSGFYSGALAFVYPSLYEGFGLPVLEAMQCGVCVLTSRDEAIHEVCGDSAVRLDARDGHAWAEAMRAVAAGGEWVPRLRASALSRAKEFSWARTARLTRAVYQEARRRFHG